MKIDVKDYKTIKNVLTNREGDNHYSLSIVFDNEEVMVYGFHSLKDFLISYSEFMNKYRG